MHNNALLYLHKLINIEKRLIMKTWKKLLLGFAGIFALTALAACSSSKDTLEKVQDKGTLTVALNPHFAPFEFKTIQNGKDTIVGADVEIAKAIADELGVKVKFSEMSFDEFAKVYGRNGLKQKIKIGISRVKKLTGKYSGLYTCEKIDGERIKIWQLRIKRKKLEY